MQAVTDKAANGVAPLPDIKLSVRQTFGIETDMEVPAYSRGD